MKYMSLISIFALAACSANTTQSWNKLPYDHSVDDSNCVTEMNGLRLETVCPDEQTETPNTAR